MRAPMVIRWPGVIKPGTVKNDIFASLDWLPTLVEIAGGPKGDGLKKQIEAGQYPGSSSHARWRRPDRLSERQVAKVGTGYVLLLFRQGPFGGPLQELEDVLRDGVRRTGGLHSGRDSPITGPRSSTSSAIPSRFRSARNTRRSWVWAGRFFPSTAYPYDWNMLQSARRCG